MAPAALFPCLCDSVDLLCCLGMTITEAHNLFPAYGRGERNYARETLTKRRDCFNAWILPILGDIEVEHLTRMDVVGLRNAIVDRHLGGHRQDSVIATLKVFCNYRVTFLRERER